MSLAREMRSGTIMSSAKFVVESLEWRRMLSFTLLTSQTFEYETEHRLDLQFNKDVSASLDPSDISLTNLTTGTQLTPSQIAVGDGTSNKYPVRVQNLPGAILADGNYESVVYKAGVAGSDGVGMLSDRYEWFYAFAPDLVRDRVIDQLDFDAWLLNLDEFNTGHSNGDANYDGVVDMLDFDMIINQFGVMLPEPPSEPGVATAYAESFTSIRVNWYPFGDGTVDGYRIFRSTDGYDFDQVGEVHDPAATTWVNDTGLTHGTKYWYRVRAFSDEAGNSASTYKYSEVTPMPPPTNLSITDITDGGLTLGWTDNATTEAHYVILRYNAEGENEGWYELPANTTSYTVDDLEENTSYQWQVYAYNDVCDSALTVMASATILTFQAPSNLRLKDAGSLGWAAWWEDHSDIETAYELTFTNPGQSPQTITVPANQTNVILPGASADATVSMHGLNGTTSSSSASVMKRDDEVYFDDFTNPSEGFADHSWSGGDTNSYLWNAPGVHVRGLFGGDGSVSLTLSNLPAHSEFNFEFGLVYVPDSDDPGDPQFAFGLSGEEASIDHSLQYLTDAGLTSGQFSPPRPAEIYATSEYLAPVHVTHHGNEATVTFVVTGLNANEYWAIHGITVTCDTPIAGIATVWNDDYAIEGSPAGDVRERAGLIVQRYFGDSSEPLPVTLNILGSETTAAANDYSGFSNQLVIPASEGDEIMEVAAVDDDTPEWTETLTVQLAPDPERFFYNPGFEKAKVEFVDNDLKIEGLPTKPRTNSDDDNANGLADALEIEEIQGEDNLVKLDLKFPALNQGSSLTLALSGGVRVFMSAQRSGVPLATGVADDPYKSQNLWLKESFTWFDNDTPPTSVYLEAVNPSVTPQDVVIKLSNIEAGAAHPTSVTKSVKATTIPNVWVVDHHDAVEGPSDPTIGFEIHRAGSSSTALTVALDSFGGTAEPDEHYRTLMVANEIEIPAGSSSTVVSMSTIDNGEVEISRTVELHLGNGGDQYQLLDWHLYHTSVRARQRHKLGVAKVFIDDDERGPASPPVPSTRPMNAPAVDIDDGKAGSGENCMTWALNKNLDWQEARTAAVSAGILWSDPEPNDDDVLVDAAMWQRVLEALLYSGDQILGYRDDGSPVATGWHRITAFYCDYPIDGKDYHFGTETLSATFTPSELIWTNKDGLNAVWYGNGAGVNRTLFNTYVVNTPMRWWY